MIQLTCPPLLNARSQSPLTSHNLQCSLTRLLANWCEVVRDEVGDKEGECLRGGKRVNQLKCAYTVGRS